MASLINAPTTFLSSVSPSSLGGNAADYQEKINGGAQREGAQEQREGQGYGYEGKEIAPGKMEFSSYKGGKKRQSNSKKRNHSKKRNQSKRQRKQKKSRRC